MFLYFFRNTEIDFLHIGDPAINEIKIRIMQFFTYIIHAWLSKFHL
jgi:hypothetical protein